VRRLFLGWAQAIDSLAGGKPGRPWR
jgi:hypothetical protein